jgi:hypothetical protein
VNTYTITDLIKISIIPTKKAISGRISLFLLRNPSNYNEIKI